jgi:hypothetical protein
MDLGRAGKRALVTVAETLIAEGAGCDIYIHNTSAKPQSKPEDGIHNFNIDLMALVDGGFMKRVNY